MSFLIPTNAVQIARFANGLYGLQLGFASSNGISSDVAGGGLIGTFNNYYSLSFGAMTTSAVAQKVNTNLGIVAGSNGQTASSVSVALAYVTGQLNAAAPAARGAAVKAVLDLWSSISEDPVNGATYGVAATAWNGQISKAVQYAGAVNPDLTVAAALLIPAAPQSYSLTTGVDTVNGSTSASNTITGLGNGGTATFTSGDAITGGAGTSNSLNVNDVATAAGSWTPTSLGGVTVSGIQTGTLTSGVSAITANTATGTQGWSGLTQLNVNSVGGTTVTTAATTSQTVTDSTQAAANETLNGGTNISLTTSGITAGGTISVGATTAPVGTVTVSATQVAGSNASAISDIIRVTGGTVDSVTSNMLAPTSTTLTTTWANTGGPITVTGALASTVAGGNATGTTSVAVTQTKAVAPTETITFLALPAAGTEIITTIDTQAIPVAYTFTITNNLGRTATAIEVAAVAAGSTSVSTAAGSLVRTVTATTTPVWGMGAASGATVTLTQSLAGGAVAAIPTFAAGTVTPVLTAATGGVLNGVVTVSDASSNSATVANTISAVTLSGIMFDPATVGSVINSNALTSLTVNNAITGSLVTINNVAAVPTAVALKLTETASTYSLVDTNSEYTSLDVVTTGTGTAAASTSTLVTGWGNLKTITVSGTSLASMTLTGSYAKLTSVAVSGGAGLTSTGFTTSANFPLLTAITSSSTGIITISIDPTKQSFTSTGTGQDIITIAAAATKAIAAGTASNNVLVWNGTSAPSTMLSTGGSTTGFSILGIGTLVTSGVFNMASYGSTFTAIDLRAGATGASQNVTGVTPGVSLPKR